MTAAGALSVSSILVRALLEITEEAGVSREALLQGTSIEPGQLQDTAGRFELRTFEQLQIRALDLTGDEALGLHMAERASEAAFDLLAHLVAHAPTLRAAIEVCSQFERLLMDGAHLRLQEHGELATIRLEFVRMSPRVDRMLSEFALAALMRMLEAFGGRGARPCAVHFEHPSPPHRREYTRVFSGVERFQRDFTGLDFSSQILDRPQLHQHAALSALLRAHAQQQLALVGQERGLIDRLQEYLLSRAPSRIPDMQTAARDLGTSVRSLRRRLAEAGMSYRALVQSTMERLAKQLLGDPGRSVQETAYTLGFADAAAFHRAFKRWTGLTPHEFREGKKRIASDTD
jgi:AraC-like DNA-binding protein